MKVALSNGGFAVVDEEDFPLVSAHRWAGVVICGNRYATTAIDGKTTYMHRLIFGACAPPLVDHKDGDSLNNRRMNLRAATRQQNQCNQKLSRANKSGFKGVRKVWQRWQARTKFNGRCIHIGTFDTPEEAAEAYDRTAVSLFGEFAMTNRQLGLLT